MREIKDDGCDAINKKIEEGDAYDQVIMSSLYAFSFDIASNWQPMIGILPTTIHTKKEDIKTKKEAKLEEEDAYG